MLKKDITLHSLDTDLQCSLHLSHGGEVLRHQLGWANGDAGEETPPLTHVASCACRRASSRCLLVDSLHMPCLSPVRRLPAMCSASMTRSYSVSWHGVPSLPGTLPHCVLGTSASLLSHLLARLSSNPRTAPLFHSLLGVTIGRLLSRRAHGGNRVCADARIQTKLVGYMHLWTPPQRSVWFGQGGLGINMENISWSYFVELVAW
jgi:hypothetical protein